MPNSVTEQLTANFYLWERRGRGWDVWDTPVDLEPPFEPFFHSYPVTHISDDGRKSTILSSLADSVKKLFVKSAEGAEGLLPEETIVELSASPFECEFKIKELSIELPITEKVTPEYAEELLLNLGYCPWPLSFELIGGKDAISVQLACREPDVANVKQQLRAYYPELSIKEGVDLQKIFGGNSKETVIIDCALAQEFMRPLRTFRSFDPDPSVGIYAVLESLGANEAGLVQVLFQAPRHPWASSMIRSVRDNWGDPFFSDAPEMLPLAKEKIRRPIFAVVLRVAALSPSEDRTWEIAKNLVGGLSTLSQPESNLLIPLANDGYDDQVHLDDLVLRQSHRSGMLLNSEELTGFVHLPSPSVRSSKLRGRVRKTKAVPAITVGNKFILGENVHNGIATEVSLSVEQRLRHIHITGSTGTGKSTLLLNLILQDMKQGAGCGVLDPHGDLIDRILELVPDERIEDVVLFDPTETEYPVGFNILEARSEVEKNVMSSDLAALFRRFSTSWGDQMTTVLGNAVSVFLESREGGTLLDLRRLLIEKDYRNECLKKVLDPEIIYFWEKQFPLLKGAALSSILTRLDIFLRPRTIRNIVGQRKGLDCNEIINTKKIFLVKLAQGLIGEENSYLLGSLLVSKLHQAAMARQVKDISERQPFYLYIDEFQNFVTPSMAVVLSGARKYGLGLVLAHQDLRQLWSDDTQLANSLMTNPVTRICFRLGDFDAEKLQAGFSFFDSSDLQNLGVGEAILRVERKEYDFNLHTFPPPKTDALQAQHVRENVIVLSRKKYGRLAQKAEIIPEAEVEIAAVTPSKIPIEVQKTEREVVPTGLGWKPVQFPEEPPAAVGQKRSEHRYLQMLIKKIAEDRGYRAIIEEQTPDGLGRVDVGLERNGKRIACEISVTTGEVQELHNIEKCLRGGYDPVIVCSPEKKNLDAIRKLMTEKLPPADQSKVLLFEPEELFFFLDQKAAKEATREERVKGYRVKVHYKAVTDTEKKNKRDAVTQVIIQSLRRLNK